MPGPMLVKGQMASSDGRVRFCPVLNQSIWLNQAEFSSDATVQGQTIPDS